jgi:hypothetical protein
LLALGGCTLPHFTLQRWHRACFSPIRIPQRWLAQRALANEFK